MSRRKRTTSAAPSVATVVRAIFDPAGDIHVRAVAPSGNAYAVAPRTPFPIAAEDVDWFFHEWNWEHRQRLCREEEYQPRRSQFNNGRQVEDRPDRPQFDNGVASRKTLVEAPERSAFDNGKVKPVYQAPEPFVAPEPVVESEESIEPDPVVETELKEA